MFNKNQKKFNEEEVKTLVSELTTMNIMIDRLTRAVEDNKREIRNIQTQINDKVREELDTTQRRYITMLEGKLIQFDEEAAKIKGEREIERLRLNGYFYSGGRP